MSESDTTHGTGASDATHGDGHGHEVAGEPPGPLDLRAWAVAIGGGAVGVLVALAMFAAAQS